MSKRWDSESRLNQCWRGHERENGDEIDGNQRRRMISKDELIKHHEMLRDSSKMSKDMVTAKHKQMMMD